MPYCRVLFVCGGILSATDYNSTRVGVVLVVVIVVVVADSTIGQLKNALSYQAEIFHGD